MKKKHTLFFLILLTNCTRVYLTTTANGYNIINKGEFKLKNSFSHPNDSLLSTSQIYYPNCGNSGASQWLKFYADGKVSSGIEIIQGKGFYNDTLLLSGYYKIIGNDLTIEITDGGKFRNDWSILIVKGKVEGDTLKFYKDQWKGKGKNVSHFTNLKSGDGKDCYYVKSVRSFSLKLPDW